MTGNTVGDVIGTLADDQLQEERQLKDSLAQRAAIVISTSGTLVTLALGAAALITQHQSFRVPHSVLVEVAIAVVLFIVAALASLLVNGAWKQGAIPAQELQSVKYKADWATVNDDKAREIHDVRLDLIVRLRAANKWRARLLMLALSMECGAMVSLAIGTLDLLLLKH
jgi:hypothetical protein